jgi:hypothetical protein
MLKMEWLFKVENSAAATATAQIDFSIQEGTVSRISPVNIHWIASIHICEKIEQHSPERAG